MRDTIFKELEEVMWRHHKTLLNGSKETYFSQFNAGIKKVVVDLLPNDVLFAMGQDHKVKCAILYIKDLEEKLRIAELISDINERKLKELNLKLDNYPAKIV